MKLHLRLIVLISASFISCNSSVDKNYQKAKINSIADKNKQSQTAKRTDTLVQLDLDDSAKLLHVKNQFYKGATGHLYERTFYQREITPDDTSMFVEYFNGNLIQDIDPMTFEELNGWYAKDKYHVYYYSPTSGGMLSVKLKTADPNTFAMLKDQYEYGADKNGVFRGAELLMGLNPKKLKIIKNKEGQISKLISGSKTYRVD